eukprot:GHVU01012512.1.p1 GENE.GHVU01012512.1~~GHVU01012512.1.p1  ORF type:complete len:227 (+),score=21.65 GHVU01012512.1:713-1393(+)
MVSQYRMRSLSLVVMAVVVGSWTTVQRGACSIGYFAFHHHDAPTAALERWPRCGHHSRALTRQAGSKKSRNQVTTNQIRKRLLQRTARAPPPAKKKSYSWRDAVSGGLHEENDYYILSERLESLGNSTAVLVFSLSYSRPAFLFRLLMQQEIEQNSPPFGVEAPLVFYWVEADLDPWSMVTRKFDVKAAPTTQVRSGGALVDAVVGADIEGVKEMLHRHFGLHEVA